MVFYKSRASLRERQPAGFHGNTKLRVLLRTRLWSRPHEAPSCCVFADSSQTQGALMTAAGGRGGTPQLEMAVITMKSIRGAPVVFDDDEAADTGSPCRLKHSAAAWQERPELPPQHCFNEANPKAGRGNTMFCCFLTTDQTWFMDRRVPEERHEQPDEYKYTKLCLRILTFFVCLCR